MSAVASVGGHARALVDFHTPSQWGGAFAALPLNAKRLRNFGDPRYVTVSLRVSEDADKDFAEKLINDATAFIR